MFNSKKKGVIPDGGELLKTFGARRELALYKVGTSDNWLSLKLILVVGTAPKANYRLFWDGERFGKTHDWTMLAEHRPAVASDILEYLTKEFKTWESDKKAERTSEGVVPGDAPKIGELKNIDGVDWLVFDVVATSPNNRGVKIVAAGRVVGRANYSLEWNGKRFIRDKNFTRLAERLDLLTAAEDFMEEYVRGESFY